MRLTSLAVALSLVLTFMGLAATSTTTKSKAPVKKAVTPAKKSVTPATKSASTAKKLASSSSSKGKAPAKTAASRNSHTRKPVTNWRTRQVNPTPDRYKEIQQALVEKGYLKSEPSGVWDADSIDAMTRFQNDQKLPATGKITAASLIGLGLGAKSAGAPEAPSLPGAPGKQPTPPPAEASTPPPAAAAAPAAQP
ncbi:MAG TPA: peptidoglycan-binding domain-containing protein [Bryobacteraceae bacterium]|nr:peptidoglycan-binding domain-containing protein [Bryobacteraceae bacterium]